MHNSIQANNVHVEIITSHFVSNLQDKVNAYLRGLPDTATLQSITIEPELLDKRMAAIVIVHK